MLSFPSTCLQGLYQQNFSLGEEIIKTLFCGEGYWLSTNWGGVMEKKNPKRVPLWQQEIHHTPYVLLYFIFFFYEKFQPLEFGARNPRNQF